LETSPQQPIKCVSGVPGRPPIGGAELQPFKPRCLVLNAATHQLGDTIDFIGRTVRRFDARHPLDYRFVDDADRGAPLAAHTVLANERR
jgi:hypothetical protein